jgi:predicted nucleic acid-binding protein
MIFVDSNVPMYVAGRDHRLREPSRRFLERARAGEIEICTSTEVLQEILCRYAALKRRDLAATVYDLFVQLCPVVFPVTLADTDRARTIIAENDAVTVRDAIHVAVMVNNSVNEIATFDQEFDAFAGVTRIQL